MEEIRKMYQTIVDYVPHPICIQISGGEPTIRDDLPEIVRLGKNMGIDYIELNTNGVRLGEDIEFLKSIKEAGVESLYFSFYGLHSDIYMKTCGMIFAAQAQSPENCKKWEWGSHRSSWFSQHKPDRIGGRPPAKKWVPTVMASTSSRSLLRALPHRP
jgi:uncharacterized radical SAM superfamily Fe-S cluster-containing enzyme